MTTQILQRHIAKASVQIPKHYRSSFYFCLSNKQICWSSCGWKVICIYCIINHEKHITNESNRGSKAQSLKLMKADIKVKYRKQVLSRICIPIKVLLIEKTSRDALENHQIRKEKLPRLHSVTIYIPNYAPPFQVWIRFQKIKDFEVQWLRTFQMGILNAIKQQFKGKLEHHPILYYILDKG